MTDTPLIHLADGTIRVGLVGGIIRRLETGQKIPLHTHVVEHANHITVVLEGSVVCGGRPAIEGCVLKAGDVVDWVLGEPHEMTALEPTRLVQIRKGA